MNTLHIDFSLLGDEEDFYQIFKEKLTLPEYFGDNLDALWDYLTTELPLPIHIEFVNMSVEQLDIFSSLLETMQEAEEELEGFNFSYFLEQYE